MTDLDPVTMIFCSVIGHQPSGIGFPRCVSAGDRGRYLISEAESASPPLRVMILLRMSLLICVVTVLTLPSHLAKFTRFGCLLAQ